MPKRKTKAPDLSAYLAVTNSLKQDYSGEEEIEYYPTGSVYLDEALGGGFPKGRFTEFHGGEGVGKSTFALQVGAHIARTLGIPVLFHDFEKGMNNNYIKSTQSEDVIKSGLLTVLRPVTFRDFEDIFAKTQNTIPPLFHIVDSISAISRSGFDEESVEDTVVGKDSLCQTKLVKKYKNICAAKGITVLWINQMRANIDFSPNPNKPKLKPAGGKAYDHALDVRIAFSRIKQIKDDKKVVGQIDGMKCTKNKYRISQENYKIPFLYGYGISTIMSLKTLMKDGNILVSVGKGNKIKFPGEEVIELTGKVEVDKWIVVNQDKILSVLRDIGILIYA